MTKAEANALTWLRRHAGDGVFDKHGVLLAAGERAPVMRRTWNAFRDLGLVEFYHPAGKDKGRGRGRARVTPRGLAIEEAA